MRPDAAAADRQQEVRDAARSWRQAGFIEADALAAIETLYPDDRKRVGPMFRLLLFFFAAFATLCAYFLIVLFLGASQARFTQYAILALLCGIGCVVLTEYQIGPLRRRQGGTEAATSLLALLFLQGFGVWVFDTVAGFYPDFTRYLMVYSGLLYALAAWRWGYELYAGVAAAMCFGFLASFPGARSLWILGAAAVFFPAWLKAKDPRLTPSHRRCFELVLLVALAALYAAVHIGSYDKGLLESGSMFGRHRADSFVPNQPIRLPSILATALVPLAAIGWGFRKRSRLWLAAGLLLLLASLVTLRFYVHVAPLWVVLIAGGALWIAVVAVLRRWLEAAPDHVRHGFTAKPLLADTFRLGLVEIAVAEARLAPAPQVSAPEPGFQGGGGSSGGGGASGTF